MDREGTGSGVTRFYFCCCESVPTWGGWRHFWAEWDRKWIADEEEVVQRHKSDRFARRVALALVAGMFQLAKGSVSASNYFISINWVYWNALHCEEVMGRQLVLASSCQAADAAVLRIMREIVFFPPQKIGMLLLLLSLFLDRRVSGGSSMWPTVSRGLCLCAV